MNLADLLFFLDFLGQESLVWFGTSLKNESNEIPLIIKINGVNTYFYNKGIMKVPTMKLVGKWRNNNIQKIINLTNKEQQKLITKFSTLTLQPNPYLTINELKENN
ncbi:hypothetical protein [Spiroplasma endosymbiont of Nebria brevicollis]|uniref:hypothetical protein n=1 Tax=Spiroplasma endosymbiont of Nebria brevicollis TaxID=3066284 RepID=UPI00313B8872